MLRQGGADAGDMAAGGGPDTVVEAMAVEVHHEHDVRRTCAGCGEKIQPGLEASVLVQRASHVMTVYAHDMHREAARANTLEDTSWQRDQSHYAG